MLDAGCSILDSGYLTYSIKVGNRLTYMSGDFHRNFWRMAVLVNRNSLTVYVPGFIIGVIRLQEIFGT